MTHGGGPLLSVVMPAYNERATIADIIEKVLAAPIPKELIVVDDGSTDGTREVLSRLSETYANDGLRVLLASRNQGKGAALRRGIQAARGQYVVIQDADLEYDPREYPRLLRPCLEQGADVVYGSRFVGGSERRVLLFWHAVGNWMLTILSNAFTDLNLTDMETGYKLFRREVIQSLELKQDRFGFEPEVTAKISHRGLRIYEVGISYNGRGYEEGKKIGWKDAIEAFYCIVRYGIEARARRAVKRAEVAPPAPAVATDGVVQSAEAAGPGLTPTTSGTIATPAMDGAERIGQR